MNNEIKEILKANKELKNELSNLQDTLKDREEYITHLEELCNKYEEEHSTSFKLWKQEMEKMPTYEEKLELQQRIDKAVEYIKKHSNNCMFELRIEEMEKLLNILKGEDKK